VNFTLILKKKNHWKISWYTLSIASEQKFLWIWWEGVSQCWIWLLAPILRRTGQHWVCQWGTGYYLHHFFAHGRECLLGDQESCGVIFGYTQDLISDEISCLSLSWNSNSYEISNWEVIEHYKRQEATPVVFQVLYCTVCQVIVYPCVWKSWFNLVYGLTLCMV